MYTINVCHFYWTAERYSRERREPTAGLLDQRTSMTPGSRQPPNTGRVRSRSERHCALRQAPGRVAQNLRCLRDSELLVLSQADPELDAQDGVE